MRKLLDPGRGSLAPGRRAEPGRRRRTRRRADLRPLRRQPAPRSGLNDANVDIWILTNLYDTLIRSIARRQGPGAGARDRVGGLGRRHRGDPDAARRRQVRRRLGHDRRGRQVVARPRPQSRERHLERPDRLDRLGRDRGPADHRAEAQESGSDHHPGARRVQHRDHAQGAVRGRARRDRCREGEVLRRAPDRHRPVRVRELGARHRRCASCATRTIGSRARTASRCPISMR